MGTPNKTKQSYSSIENLTKIVKYVKKYAPMPQIELVRYMERTFNIASKQAAYYIIKKLVVNNYLEIDERRHVKLKQNLLLTKI